MPRNSETKQIKFSVRTQKDIPVKRKTQPSCFRCRQRHIRCDGNGSPCSQCSLAKKQCEYIEGERKVVVAVSYLNKLHQEISKLTSENTDVKTLLDQCLQKLNDSSVPQELAQDTSSDLIQDEDDFDDLLTKPISPFLDNRGNLVSFHSANYTVHNLIDTEIHRTFSNQEPLLKTLLTIPSILVQRNNMDFSIIIGQSSVQISLPVYTEAVRLIDTFVAYTEGCFYFFNEGILREDMNRLYEKTQNLPILVFSETDNHAKTALMVCKLEIIFKTAKLFQGNHYTSSFPLFDVLFSSKILQSLADRGGVETMLLYGHHLQQTDHFSANSIISLAAHWSLSLGYHFDLGADKIQRAELEHRRRLFWTIYIVERMMAISYGYPVHLVDSEISCDLPESLQIYSCRHYVFPEPEMLQETVAITKINLQVLRSLYNKQPGKSMLNIVREMVVQLLRWKRSLPDSINCDYGSGDVNNSRSTANMMIEYFQGLNLAVRPLLLHFSRLQHGRDYMNLQDCSTIMLSLLNASFQASMNTVRSLWNLWEKDQLMTGTRSDMEYLYTAIATLVLFNVNFGVHDTTRFHIDHALHIFRTLAEQNNQLGSFFLNQTLELLQRLDQDERELLERYGSTETASTEKESRKQPDTAAEQASLKDMLSDFDILVALSGPNSELWNQEIELLK
ncbi:hypothetical protein OGAPHI_006348 [Ogataea philodendri]|uniref:Zn(2)-C6 fungal-type domain-containing protein n=1 Tax=Ogataea philodendri TaxID=1378263 RepID=A0A9P8T0J2_9ASCO|nr:uncharacterized protein OGAPHI_006348 [Ogataea philodendri]KAH3661501.1 hypothetical protein OGAPHI_006348 [Ogataea philodendri]